MPQPTKTKQPSRTGSTPLVGEGAEAHVAFGITFNLRGQLIPVSTASIAEAKEKGIELGLPGPVELGSFEDFSKWFKEQFNVDIPKAEELPKPLDEIIGKLTKLVVTVSQAWIHVPSENEKEKEKKVTEYVLMLTAEWPKSEGGIELIPKVLTIEGAMFGVSNKQAQKAAITV
jgi:hypothetical protein